MRQRTIWFIRNGLGCISMLIREVKTEIPVSLSQNEVAIMILRRFERRSFLQSVVAVSAVRGVPRVFSVQPSSERTNDERGNGPKQRVFTVATGASRPGKSIPLGEHEVSVKVSGDDNSGGFALFEVPAGPESGPPLHLHHVENEFFYALEGELKVQVGTELFHLEPGGSIYLPRMIPHTWQTVGGKPVRFLSFAQPAGRLEAYLVALSASLRQGIRDPASMKALFEKYGMEMVGPPLSGDGPNVHTTR